MSSASPRSTKARKRKPSSLGDELAPDTGADTAEEELDKPADPEPGQE